MPGKLHDAAIVENPDGSLPTSLPDQRIAELLRADHERITQDFQVILRTVDGDGKLDGALAEAIVDFLNYAKLLPVMVDDVDLMGPVRL